MKQHLPLLSSYEVQGQEEESCWPCTHLKPAPPTLLPLLAEIYQSPKVTVLFGAETQAHEWEELELLLFGVAVTRYVRRPLSPLTAVLLSVLLSDSGLHELSLQKHRGLEHW